VPSSSQFGPVGCSAAPARSRRRSPGSDVRGGVVAAVEPPIRLRMRPPTPAHGCPRPLRSLSSLPCPLRCSGPSGSRWRLGLRINQHRKRDPLIWAQRPARASFFLCSFSAIAIDRPHDFSRTTNRD